MTRGEFLQQSALLGVLVTFGDGHVDTATLSDGRVIYGGPIWTNDNWDCDVPVSDGIAKLWRSIPVPTGEPK